MVYIHDSSNRLESLEISSFEEDDEDDDLNIGEIVQIKNKGNGFKRMKGRIKDVTNNNFLRYIQYKNRKRKKYNVIIVG